MNYYGYTHTVLGNVTIEEPEDEEKPDSPYDEVASADSATDWYKGQSNTDTVLTDIQGGGVNIDQSSTSAERPFCYAPNLGSIEGLRLFFGNYDQTDIERLSLVMTLHDVGFSSAEAERYMRLALSDKDTSKERAEILRKKRNGTLDEIHIKQEQLDRLDFLRFEITKVNN